MNGLKKYCLHPFLFTAYPILALYAVNWNLIGFGEVCRSLVVSLAAVVVLFLLLYKTRLSSQRIGLVISITSILFFSYGHVMVMLANAQLKGLIIPRPYIATLFWPVSWILLTWASIRLIKNLDQITFFLNIVSIALSVMVAFQVLGYELNNLLQPVPRIFDPQELVGIKPSAVSNSLKRGDVTLQPDIYYIILDGYGREDILKSVMGFDNSTFIHALQNRGFYVAHESTSNYSNTGPSLASSLNFGYINQLIESVSELSMNYRPLHTLIGENRMFQILRQNGYKIVTFETGFSITEIHTSDQYLGVACGLNPFETLLLTGSLALLWTTDQFADCYRERITGTLAILSSLPNTPEPKFVFAHVMAAHPPFVLGSQGESKGQSTRVELDGGNVGSRVAEVQGYRDQVSYINRLVLDMVDGILKNSAVKPVIILQGDHGPGIYMDWQSAENTCFDERKAIFNAYYFPHAQTGLLYPSISPVNSFRVVLNMYFGTNLPFLEDKNYFSLFESPYDFADITNQSGICPFR